MKKCFVVSPIGEEGSDIRKRADKVYKYIIDPVCKECDFEAIRVDQLNKADSITQTIVDMLVESELVIADITGHNPNAFYEIGYRASINKPMIYLKDKSERIPFDIASIRVFDYDLSDLDMVDQAKERLKQTILSFNISENKKDQVKKTEDEKKQENYGQIIPILYGIQDRIDKLREEIHNKETETIQAIVKAAHPVEDQETMIMRLLLPELIKNPQSMEALMEFSEKANRISNGKKNNLPK